MCLLKKEDNICENLNYIFYPSWLMLVTFSEAINFPFCLCYLITYCNYATYYLFSLYKFIVYLTFKGRNLDTGHNCLYHQPFFLLNLSCVNVGTADFKVIYSLVDLYALHLQSFKRESFFLLLVSIIYTP